MVTKKELEEQNAKMEAELERYRLQNVRPSVNPQEAEAERQRLRNVVKVNKKGSMIYSRTDDHKNIFLYTPLNKKIGPLHPDNAPKTMDMFREKGIQLYTQPRTDQQIQEFKNTDYYKAYKKKRDKERESRSRGSDAKDRQMIEEIAKGVGTAVAKEIKSG